MEQKRGKALTTYACISDQGINKLDPKLKKCIFIDNSEDEFGYYI